MDELFHIPQAQEICRKLNARKIPVYHPSITTLPGVYLPNAVLALFLRSSAVCSTRWLRATSALAALLCLPLLANVLYLLRRRWVDTLSCYSNADENDGQRQDERVQNFNIWLTSLVIWLHPVFLFYANLFYTDTSSSFWLLTAWYLSLRGRQYASALCGFFATLTRQTNMVWHAFIVVDAIVHYAVERKRPEKKYVSMFMVRRIVSENVGHGAAFLMYIAFLMWNAGVAVGDKSNHGATLHYAMFPYFLGFHTISYFTFEALAPVRIRSELRTLSQPKVAVSFTVICLVLAALVSATADKVHPFILADNRHFTFYVYRRWILRSSWQRLLLVPIYGWSLLGCFNDTNITRRPCEQGRRGDSRSPYDNHLSHAERILDCMFFLCVAATLVPSGLLEPRYFSMANFILTLRRLSRSQLRVTFRNSALMAAFCVALNMLLIFIFAELPFERPPDPHMPSDKSPGRFMF